MRRQLLLAAVALGIWLLSRGKSQQDSGSSSGKKKRSAKVDALFLKRLLSVLRVCIPSVFCKESMILTCLTILLIIRTRLTVIVAHIVGDNAKQLVQRDVSKFMSGVLDIGLWSLPSSVVNSGIKFLTGVLETRCRENLQRELHQCFLHGFAVNKLVERRDTLDNPDHRLTNDVHSFCTEIAEIFPQIFKPTIDVITFMIQLSHYGGFTPPMLMIGYYFLAGNLMRTLMPNFAKLTAKTAQKEGDFRWIHNQLVQHAEEVAFYRGEKTEREYADRAIDSLVKHELHVKQLKSYADFMDGVLIKYGATCVGYSVCSIGVFALRGKASSAEMTRVYIQSSQLYIPLAQAIGKLVMLHQRITALAGHTARVGELRECLKEIQKTSASQNSITVVPRSDIVSIRDIDVCTPDGHTLLKDFSLDVPLQGHVLIMGNNGAGKTALLRAIAGIWPCKKGEILRPPLEDITFLSQRTYLPQGTFRQQLVFPDTLEDVKKKGITDDELMQAIEEVGLTHVVEREGGLDSLKEWHEVLSGGERQKVAFVRLLYARPKFGILDEATSATDQRIEPKLYEAAQRRGVTLITVSHREALLPFHRTVVMLDGLGGAKISPVTAATA